MVPNGRRAACGVRRCAVVFIPPVARLLRRDCFTTSEPTDQFVGLAAAGRFRKKWRGNGVLKHTYIRRNWVRYEVTDDPPEA